VAVFMSQAKLFKKEIFMDMNLKSIVYKIPYLRDIYYDLKYAGFPLPFRVIRPHSLLSNVNLFFLAELIHRLEDKGVQGDFLECGVYNGGSAGLLAWKALQSQFNRKVYLYDAFSGMPKANDIEDDAYSQSIEGKFIGSEQQVRRIMKRLLIPNERFEIRKGWFEQTLPASPKCSIALLHIDCDFYDPVKLVLETLYSQVVVGGYVILNDYGSFQGCRIAVDEFIASLSDDISLNQIDRDAFFFIKK
jgi:O-methyltransferase